MRVFTRSTVFLSKLRGCIAESKLKALRLSYNRSLIPVISQRLYIFPTTFSTYIAAKHFSSFVSGKIHKEVENEYAHSIMENSNSYSQSILKCPPKIDDDLDLNEPKNLFHTFANVTALNACSSSLENPKYSLLIKNICSLLPQASDHEVQTVLHYLCMWPPTPKTASPNFKALWNTLDQECTKRVKDWDVSYKLLIADYWFCLRLNRITQYNREMILSLLQNCESLSNQQTVQLMFYVNLQRELPDRFLSKLEKKLESIINSLTIEEIGIICLAYFKTESKVSNDAIIKLIIKHMVANIDKVHTVTVVAILKFLRKSYRMSLLDAYILSLHKSVPYIKSWDIPTSVHLALLSSECNIYHPMLLANVADKLTHEINLARIKDCTKLSLCLTHFNHFEEEFYDALISELKKFERQKELRMHPKDLVFLSIYYAYLGKYDFDILSIIFQKDFIQWCCNSHLDLLHVLAEIDYCIEIECENYYGPRLEKSLRKVLNKRRGNIPSKSNNQNMQTRLLSNVCESLHDILGSDDNFMVRHILPHCYSPDIIFKQSDQSQKSLKNICLNVPSDVVLIPPKDCLWACFVVCGSFSFANRSKQITGVTTMKLRQLQKLGYYVIFLPFYDIPQNSLTRKDFISELMNSFKESSLNVVNH